MITYTNLRFTEIIIIILFLTLSNILFGQQPEYRVVQIPVYLTEGSLNDNAVVAGYTSSY